MSLSFTDPFASKKAAATTPMVTLAEDITHYAGVVSDWFTHNDLPQPSLELDAPEDYPAGMPEDIQEARSKLREAAATMSAIAAGPKESIMWLAWEYHDITTLMYIDHFKVAEAVPLIGSISFSEVAAATKTNEGQLRRIVRYAMLNHVFAEPEPGMVAHTSASRQLVTSEQVKAWIGYRCNETAPAAFKLVDAIEKWGGDAQEREQTPYSLAHSNGKLSRFDYLALPENKDKEVRFAILMKALQSHDGWKLDHVVNGIPWEELGENAKVVDIGGNTGATAFALANAHPNLKIVVEDLPTVVAEGRSALPAALEDRVEFVAYDFFEQIQPVTDAAVYFMRFIPHDWPDKYAAKLLQNTAKIMKRGQRMIIMDSVVPPPAAAPRGIERQIRRMDMEMLTQFNSLEREASDWETVLKRADPRLEIKSISKPPGSVMSIIEVVIGSEELKEAVDRKVSLTYGRRGSLLYANTTQMDYGGRKDSVAFSNVAGRV